tara:strand:+ start:6538 stop:7734 length:1197 start_codon:yes stop_codon:yes gene_type:complete
MADRKITALTELTGPVGDDFFPIIDSSEAANADKNKKIRYDNVLKVIPNGTVSSPSIMFTGDSNSGLYRSAANTLSVSISGGLVGSFQSNGFQLGAGTPAAQLHLFSSDTSDQIIFENSDAGTDTAPDLILYRNSASPANADNLGNIVLRGEDSAGNTHDYASITSSILTVTNGSEDGILDLMSSSSGTLASRIRLSGDKVGFGESSPAYPVHITTAGAGTALWIECSANDAASTADITLYSRRGASGAGQDSDVLSTIFFRGKNDAGTPEQVDYCSIEALIVDASDGTEDGRINFKVMNAGTLTSPLSIRSNLLTCEGALDINDDITFAAGSDITLATSTGTKIGTGTNQLLGFWNATPVDQPAAIADLSGSASLADTITKVNAVLAALREVGLIAS